MDKDLGRIRKNPETEIVVRVDDFGGKAGVTIREFVTSDKYTGFTKSGTRIPAESFEEFKKMINSIKKEDLESTATENVSQAPKQSPKINSFSKSKPKKQVDEVDEDLESSGVDEEGLM